MVAVGVFGMGLSGYAQTTAKSATDEMSLADLRAYMDVLHIKDADERGVRVQMEAQKKQLPPWFPPSIVDEMTTEMLKVDFAAIEYPSVKTCLTGSGIRAMTAMFATPDGQAYANKLTGTIVDSEAKGSDAVAAHQQAEKEDSGVPAGALEKLAPAQRDLVEDVFKSGAMDCLGTGFGKGNEALTEARTQAARQVVQAHRVELQAAKDKYDAANPAPK